MSNIRANIHGIDNKYIDLNHKYIICSVIDGELWYYGQDDDLDKVKKICKDKLVNKCYFEILQEEDH